MPSAVSTWRRTAHVAVLLLALLTALALGHGTAHAAETCDPDAETACLGGALRTSAGEPADGVVLTITGPGEPIEVTTGEDGRWSVGVGESGDYTVELDVESLPAGEQLRDPAVNPRTVTVTLGASAGVLFPLGGAVAPPADGATSDPSTPGTPAPGGDGEGDVAPETASAEGASAGDRVAQLVVSGLLFGLLLALASVGLSLIYGTTGLSNFAHGEQVTLGALIAYFLVQSAGVPLVLAGALAVLVGLASGYLQDRALWAPLRKRNVGLTQQMIVSIGLAMALQYTFNLLAGGGSLRIVTSTPRMVELGPVLLTEQSAVSMLIAVLTLGGVAYFLVGTRTGRAARAVADNAALASASGIDVVRIVRLVWTMGAGLAALGGVLIGLYFSATRWNMGTAILLLMFAAVTLGGLGTAFGALAGSIVIGLVVELSTLVLPSDMRYAAALLILIVVLLVRPQGILGRPDRVG